jgi:uncharacterized protein (TIGR00251 family)
MINWSELQIREDPRGSVMTVRAHPGARREGITGIHGGALRVAVSCPAERGRANEAMIDLLAKRLGCARRALELVAGDTSRQKRVLVTGLRPEELRMRLQGG